MGIPHLTPSYKATLHSKMKNLAHALYNQGECLHDVPGWAPPSGHEQHECVGHQHIPGNELGEAPCAWMQPVTPMRPTGDMMLYMGEIGAPSWIIDTDYETYAAGYACEEGPLGHIKNAAISTRDPTAPQEAVDKAFDAFARNGIEMNDWYPVVHTEDCVYDNDKERWCKD